MLAAKDLTNAVMVPGSSLIDELLAIHEPGLTNFDELATATKNVGRFLACPETVGTFAIGPETDLLLVEGNMLERLDVVRRSCSVLSATVSGLHSISLKRDWEESKALRTIWRTKNS